MTITSEHISSFEIIADEFHPQHEPDDCYPTAIWNIAMALADTQDFMSEFDYSKSDFNDRIGYKAGSGSPSDRIADRFDPVFNEFGYEVSWGTENYQSVDNIISDSDLSYPICDFHQDYLTSDFVPDSLYTVDPGRDGIEYTHVVIPLYINKDEVLFYDPLMHYFNDIEVLTESEAIRMDQELFWEFWSKPPKRWTMWLEPQDRNQGQLEDYL